MYNYIFIIADIITIFLAYLLSLLLRFKDITNVVGNQWPTLIFLLFINILLFSFHGLNNHLLFCQRLRVFFKLVKAWLISILIYVVIGFLTKFYFLVESRALILSFFLIAASLSIVVRLILIPLIIKNYFSRPERKIACKYIGPPTKFKKFKKFIQENPVTGLACIASDLANPPAQPVKTAFLFSETKDFGTLYQQICNNLLPNKPLHVVSPLFDELGLSWEWCKIDSVPVYTFQPKENQKLRDLFRRGIDIIGAIITLIVLLPLFLTIAIMIKLDSPGPIVYKQTRLGRNGKEFTLYKFRSMFACREADARREGEFKDYMERKTPKGKVLDQEGITTIGRILRKTSFDELPQFFNVLKGEMSLIGPRPPIPYEVKYYKEWHKDRLSVKPGISGLWQIYGRGNMPCDSSIFLDLMYIINRSISLDIRLMFETIPAVILGKGAY